MNSQEKPEAVPGTDAATPPPATGTKAPAAKEAEARALLLKPLGEIPAGRIVRGPASEIRALPADIARLATPGDLAIAGGRTVRLPRK